MADNTRVERRGSKRTRQTVDSLLAQSILSQVPHAYAPVTHARARSYLSYIYLFGNKDGGDSALRRSATFVTVGRQLIIDQRRERCGFDSRRTSYRMWRSVNGRKRRRFYGGLTRRGGGHVKRVTVR